MPGTDTHAAGTGEGQRVITIRSDKATREIRLSPSRQRFLIAGSALALVWTLTASASFVMSLMSPDRPADSASAMSAAYEARIASLTAERDARAEEALSAQLRYDMALDRLSEQQTALLASAEAQHELHTGLQLMRQKLTRAIDERDRAENRASELRVALDTLQQDAGQAPDQARELGVVLAAVSDALHSAVRDRDLQKRDLDKLETEVASLELKMQINAERQERMVASLEDAVEASFGPLESLFQNTGMDVDSILNNVRRSYSGVGGPIVEASASAALIEDGELADRYAALMGDMDRMNMLRVAAAKVPFAIPVRQAFRFTSGFGVRRDPKTGGRRAHNGVDLAGPRGTPVNATADGVVVFAGRQSGFGNLIKIRHDFGFETFYAHLNKIHVKVGDRIARGEHIGDMGNTGRSTGTHLHYEVRQSGKPVNPMTYIRAARDVF